VRFDGLAAFMPVSRDGNHRISPLDDDDQRAVMGTPDRRFLWILARDRCLPAEGYGPLVARVRRLGFVFAQFVTC
jgi:lipocalin